MGFYYLFNKQKQFHNLVLKKHFSTRTFQMQQAFIENTFKKKFPQISLINLNQDYKKQLLKLKKLSLCAYKHKLILGKIKMALKN
jgi:hypothetical protein